ncbi:MAG: HAD family phosphatase [Chloroflexi bacterium]|nr:HAD family phosphatase [Chloroflexota bacterium]
MPIRLIASDLDGTLRAEQFTPRLRAAVRCALARGVRVVIATGRMFLTAEWFARDLGLTDVLVTDHGATIWDLQTRTILTQQRIPRDLARAALALTPPDGTAIVCINERFYAPRMTESAIRFADRNRHFLFHAPDLAETLDAEPQKIVFVHDAETTRELRTRLARELGEQLQIVQSHDHFAEVTHRATSKGNALAWLAERWGIARNEVLAMGDQDNDRSMIEWAGIGVAMGNAIPSLQAIADYVAPRAHDDGAAIAIEKFVLE